jgi:peptidoglycan/xylan/chitin deacetylase (PgdA/CDA1 family)
MREAAKKMLSVLGYYRLLRRTRPGSVLLILMYHDLSTGEESGSVGSVLRDRISHAQFEAHLSAVRRTCRVLSVEQAIGEMRSEGRLLEDTVSVTFDDGYGSVYDIAYPLLCKYDIPATVYLTTDWIDGRMGLWWEELADMIARSDIDDTSVSGIENALGMKSGTLTPCRGNALRSKTVLHELVASYVRGLEDSDVQGALGELGAVLGYRSTGQTFARPLSWTQIREMSTGNTRFGSHTCSHINIRHASLGSIEEEIVLSKAEIEGNIDSAVEGFAYPYGQDIASYGKVEPILSRNGFSYACTALAGNNRSDSNRYALLRETLPSTVSESLLKRDVLLGLSARARV